MHALDDVIEIEFPHTDPAGRPAATLENIETIIEAFDVILARPLVNHESFTPFFPGRFHAFSAENVRDVHLSKLHDICQRHGMVLNMRTLARHLQMLGLEREDCERIEANEKRLERGLA
ncbi:hypothetical protein ACFQH5_15110 [Halomonas salifodinae]|uniref:Uncharacterized protein n=1 Tax=Halomonas salifodinae TaxID=438745 RepID=A0ABW2F327_9GAMM